MNPRCLRMVTAAAATMAATIAVADGWQDEIPITQDAVLQYRSYLATAPDDTVYALWPDWTDWKDTKVTLTKSTDQGQTWTDPTILFDGTAYDNFDLAADDAGVHVLLIDFEEDEENEYKRLYYTKSVDGGTSFSTPSQVGARTNIESIKLFTAPGFIYIYAQDWDWELDLAFNYLYVSEDGGATWDEEPLLPSYSVFNPGFVVKDGVIHLVFGGFFNEVGIFYASSATGGDSWSTPVEVTSGAGQYTQLPQVAVDDTAIHVTWEDSRTGYFNIFYTRSSDGGTTWSNDQQVNDTYYGARNKLIADDDGLHLFWCQYHGDDGWPNSWGSGDYGIVWYRSSTDSGVTWSDEFRVSQNESIENIDLPDMGANYAKVAEYQSGFCIMWQDKRDGNFDLYLRNSIPTASTMDLVDFEVVDGSHLSGGIAELLESDDQYLTTRSQLGFTAFERNLMTIVIGVDAGGESPATLGFVIESRLNNPNGTAKLRLRNWVTDQFEQVDEYPIGMAEKTYAVSGVDATNRVDGGTGRTELSIKHVVPATFTPLGFDSSFDQVQVTMN